MARIKLKESRKKIVIISSVTLVIVCLTVATVIFLKLREENDESVSVGDISREIDIFTEENDTGATLDYYDKQVDSINNIEDKKSILLMKSRFALREGESDSALQAANRAHNMGRDLATTRALAEIYAETGDRERAIAYYRELKDLLAKSGQTVQRGPSIDDLIQELQG